MTQHKPYATAMSIAVFLCGTASIVLSRHTGVAAKGIAHVDSGFTVVSSQVFYPADNEKPFLDALKYQYQARDGAFRVLTEYFRPNGSVVTDLGVSVPGRGIFKVDMTSPKAPTLVFLAPAYDPGAFHETDAELRAHPQYLREEYVSGVKAFVYRCCQSENSAAVYRELWRAPSLGGFYIKQVFYTEAGKTVIEPVQITRGAPNPLLTDIQLTLPVSFEQYEHQITKVAARGQTALAENMRQVVAEAKRGFQAPAHDGSK